MLDNNLELIVRQSEVSGAGGYDTSDECAWRDIAQQTVTLKIVIAKENVT